MDTLSLTLTNTRVIDGLIFAANSAGKTPEAYAEWLLTVDGHRFADANNYGIVTSAAFFARFTPTEYADVLAASVDTVVVPEPIGGVPTPEQQQMYDDAVAAYSLLENPTAEDTAMYETIVANYEAASTAENQAEIDAAEAQNAEAAEIKALLDELTAAERVFLDDQRVTDGLQLLVSRGLLAAERPAEITSYERPTVGGV
ncbi:MAG: hypothetical protein EBV86_15815 [Marivivens sp.]|nr:hypothetical protein [Marivivens sp.]NCW69995.1 hypothetical protein [Marivivens sp.]